MRKSFSSLFSIIKVIKVAVYSVLFLHIVFGVYYATPEKDFPHDNEESHAEKSRHKAFTKKIFINKEEEDIRALVEDPIFQYCCSSPIYHGYSNSHHKKYYSEKKLAYNHKF